ncbi:hypothetical protein [Methylobacterium sp. CCH7-A2]|jgi:hypothetical protein|uniref:hypothetical protein n=1 Tax=Methylobacterium sp. CCH7-A2 TaxID=1768789 RepID=UPI000A970E2E|nr:hypothetical protein [Methylobacterium sp. CCH7-A2]
MSIKSLNIIQVLCAVIQPAGCEVVNKNFGFRIDLALNLLFHFKEIRVGKLLLAYFCRN